MVDLLSAETLRPVFLAAEVVTLAALVWYGYWRRFPLFCCYFLLAVFVAFTHVKIDQWAGANWIPWQTVLSVGRVLCAIEAVYRLAFVLPRLSRAQGTAAVAAFVLSLELIAWGIRTESPVRMAILRMVNLEFGIAVFLLAAMVLFWGMSVQLDRWARRHALILLTLAANQLPGFWLFPVARPQWDAILALGYFVGICCCVALAVNSFYAPKSEPDHLPLTPLAEHP